MTTAPVTSVLPSQLSGNGARLRWYTAVLAVTLVPLLGLPLLSQFELPFRQSFLIGLGVFVGGVCHVASTLYFYTDHDARIVMRNMKARFYALPIATIGIAMVALVIGSQLVISMQLVQSIFFLHLTWLYFHYQRQNYGLLAFAAASSGGGRLPAATTRILMLPPLAGAFATFPRLLADGLHAELPISADWLPLLHNIGAGIYLVAAVIMLALAMRNRLLFRQPLVIVFSLIAFGFFLPAILIDDIEYAFWSYAIAHGLQYLLMVGIVSTQARWRWLALFGFVIAAIGGGWLLERFEGNNALFICGILLTWVHFVLDARLWRMSDNAVRQFLRSRFAFIFN